MTKKSSEKQTRYRVYFLGDGTVEVLAASFEEAKVLASRKAVEEGLYRSILGAFQAVVGVDHV